MNVFIVAVCVNLITLVNAAHDINFDTILIILKSQVKSLGKSASYTLDKCHPLEFRERARKYVQTPRDTQKHRKSGYSNIDETNASIEAIPIMPGFYLQKPKDLSKSLFENAKDWPDDLFSILSSEDTKTRTNKTRISAKAVNKSPRDDYLRDKIPKAERSLNKYRDMKKSIIEKITKPEAYKECDDKIYRKDILKKSNAYGARKEPLKKLMGRVFQGIKNGIYYQGKGKYKKQQNQNSSSKNEKIIRKLLKNILYGSLINNKYRGREKYEYDGTEDNSQNTGNLLGSIVDVIQNHDHGQVSEISSASLHDNDFESENNAMESMEVSDEEYTNLSSDSSCEDSLNLYLTRRKSKPDIGAEEPSDSSVSSTSSDYERNPGNPFTVHKNKYKQNWPYNHYMDGDHMNINPIGPQFGSLGPTGPELFFGRKWWYFNQDDYKPMG